MVAGPHVARISPQRLERVRRGIELMQPAVSASEKANSGSVAGMSISGSGTGSAAAPRRGDRERFGTEELAIVLSHFDIGIVESIVEYPRGSRKAPKLLIHSDQGKFLLKRRARGKDDPF